jgi:hypothetical protein
MMTEISYSGYRFPPEIIQQAIWLYIRFTLSFRDVADLLAGRARRPALLGSRGHAINSNWRCHIGRV